MTGRTRIFAAAEPNGWTLASTISTSATLVRGMDRTITVRFTPRGAILQAVRYWQDHRVDMVVYGEQDKAARVIAWLEAN